MKTNGTNYLKPNIQLFAEAAPAAPATPAAPTTPPDAGTTPASPNPAPAEPAKPAEQAKPFKTFATQADFDREVQQYLKSREDSIRTKLEPEIKAKLDKESKMTAEQKVQAQLDEIATAKKELAKEKVRIKVESLFASKGIAEADRQPMLDSVVDDNEESSLKRAQALIDAIDRATNEKIKAEMVKAKPPATGKGTGNGAESEAVRLAKELAAKRATAAKTANSTLDYYRNGGNKK